MQIDRIMREMVE